MKEMLSLVLLSYIERINEWKVLWDVFMVYFFIDKQRFQVRNTLEQILKWTGYFKTKQTLQ